MKFSDRLYVISDRKLAGDKFFQIIASLIEEGFNFIQLREKDLSADELYILGKEIIKIGGKSRLKLVINDRVDVALALNAYGVQLTEKSLEPALVKKISKKLKIGLSIHDEKRVKRFEDLCDFFVYGNVFETKSKPNVPGKGLFALRKIVSMTEKPVYAIGGIKEDNMELVLKTGCFGVALKGAIFSSEEIQFDVKKLKASFEQLFKRGVS